MKRSPTNVFLVSILMALVITVLMGVVVEHERAHAKSACSELETRAATLESMVRWMLLTEGVRSEQSGQEVYMWRGKRPPANEPHWSYGRSVSDKGNGVIIYMSRDLK